MHIEWDVNKDRANRAKHGIGFDVAQLVFDDPHHMSVQDRHKSGEERSQTIGLVHGVVVLLVAHTYREDDSREEMIRIISARKATSHERRRYEQEI